MHIDWWTLALQAINALVLVWLMARFLFRPLAAIVAQRQAAATADLMAAAEARKAAEASLAEARATATATQAGQAQAVKQATGEAEAARAAILAEARAEAVRLQEAAAAARQARSEAETAAFAAAARTLALDIATRLLARLPDDVRVTGFIDGLATAITALPEQARTELIAALRGTDGVPAPRFTVPRAMTPAERAAAEQHLAAIAGGPVAFEPATDPDLIAGVELATAHVTVRNTLKADLEAISDQLALPLPAGRPAGGTP